MIVVKVNRRRQFSEVFQLFILLILFPSFVSVKGEECPIPNQSAEVSGVCKLRSECLVYMDLIQSRPLTTEKLSFLKHVECNYRFDEPIVCCPAYGNYT